MKIIKHMVVLLLQVVLSLACYTQSPELTTKEQEEQIYRQHTTQRKRIDSFQKILPVVDDTAKVNYLNRLSPYSRIEMLQQKKQLNTSIQITDLMLADGITAGTEVIIKMPLMYEDIK